MKKAAAMLSTLVLGCATGFFGVFLSVFSYGAAKERIVTVGVILLIYIALGVVLGLIWPTLKWLKGFCWACQAPCCSSTTCSGILTIYISRI